MSSRNRSSRRHEWLPATPGRLRSLDGHCSGDPGSKPDIRERSVSEVDRILSYARRERRVTAALCFPHTLDELVTDQGRTFLNTNPARYTEPGPDGDPKHWPWLCSFFEHFLSELPDPVTSSTARASFLAELQRAYQALIDGYGCSGHMMLFAGPTGRGKSLLSTRILPLIFGSGADAGEVLMYKGYRSSQVLSKSYIWFVDGSALVFKRRRFLDHLKDFATGSAPLCRQKGFDLPWYGRIIMSCNDDPRSLAIVRNLGNVVCENLCLYRLHPTWEAEFLPNCQLEPLISSELPFFLRWLLDVFQPPRGLIKGAEPRYELHPFHDPTLVSLA